MIPERNLNSDELFELGWSVGKIESHFRKLRSEGFKRGRESERKVADAIIDLPTVNHLSISRQNSPIDRRGVDITVWLSPELAPLGSVFVQVKSSEHKIEEFKRKMRKRHKIYGPKFDDWLLRSRLMIILGTVETDEIREQFSEGLNKILNYHFGEAAPNY